MARGAPSRGTRFNLLTEVVRTPLSNAGLVGERAGGVSIHSKVSSDVVPLLILLVWRNFARRSVRNSGQVQCKRQVTLSEWDKVSARVQLRTPRSTYSHACVFTVLADIRKPLSSHS
jgi:hypothetical protein